MGTNPSQLCRILPFTSEKSSFSGIGYSQVILNIDMMTKNEGVWNTKVWE